MDNEKQRTVALAGNPNVGKSTVFNALTGMRQHTGNWPGKTVSGAVGTVHTSVGDISLVDVPGAYSLSARSPEEEIARDYICGRSGIGERKAPDAVICVCDACCLERNLLLTLQIMKLHRRVIVCVNLCDEAEKRGITVDFSCLEKRLGVPVVPCAARYGVGLEELTAALSKILMLDDNALPPKFDCADIPITAAELSRECVNEVGDPRVLDRRLDRIFAGKFSAIPVSLFLLAAVFFITLRAATPLSDALSFILGYAEAFAVKACDLLRLPDIVSSAICDGILCVLFRVISVMLPPMAIFFPLFTLLEDFGYLPRVAYTFDNCFCKCGACGKQALTLMMGFGCNAAGVTGCRIIDSERERLIAIITNSFVPCNGRFPVISALLIILCTNLGRGSFFHSALMCSLTLCGIILSLVVSRFLSRTLLHGTSSSFTLELPPYRAPQIGHVIIRSLFDRTVFVLARAAAVAAPAGLIIWALGNISFGGESLLSCFTALLDPIGHLAGMDGVMMCAFILSLPASEIILPLMIMGYECGGTMAPMMSTASLSDFFISHGWSSVTAICAVIFTLVHWPCSTTVITIYKETHSIKWTAAAVLIPTVIGYSICVAVNAVSHIFF